jgi:putative ubiquitin-RnfH superfamily antitoxin RatB of RatAB toxin-antitoxin module
MADDIEVEVVYALPEARAPVRVTLSAGATVQAALTASGLAQRFPQMMQGPLRVGVFGKLVSLDTPLKSGDRVEIYRPLTVDPKEARRRRAAIKKSIKSNT